MIDCGCKSYLRCEQMLFFGFQGGDQSPEGSAGGVPGGSPEAAALGSVRSCRSCHAACQHVFLHHYLFFLLPVPPLRIPPGLPWWRGGPQRCPVVAAGDQPTVNGGHTSGGGGGSLEESLSGNDQEKMISLFTSVIHMSTKIRSRRWSHFFPPFCVRRLLWQELEMATRVKYSNFKGL